MISSSLSTSSSSQLKTIIMGWMQSKVKGGKGIDPSRSSQHCWWPETSFILIITMSQCWNWNNSIPANPVVWNMLHRVWHWRSEQTRSSKISFDRIMNKSKEYEKKKKSEKGTERQDPEWKWYKTNSWKQSAFKWNDFELDLKSGPEYFG